MQDALRELFRSVPGRDVSLHEVLRLVATTAMDEEAAAAPLGSPFGRGLLGHLMADPRPLRVAAISEHPAALGLPPGHPQMRTLLGRGGDQQPRLPDMGPIEAAVVYRSAAVGPIGGDWYDAILLPDDTYAVVIGDVGGHGLQAAAAILPGILADRHPGLSAYARGGVGSLGGCGSTRSRSWWTTMTGPSGSSPASWDSTWWRTRRR